MSFTERDKLKALAIVHIFETSKPLGDYSAVAVLNDGAGISYGVNQFTHRSGSLAAVIDRYGKLKGQLHVVIVSVLPDLRSKRNIAQHSANSRLKTILANLGDDPLMQQAQREIAFEMYLQPAIKACEGSGFTLPLSLAVVYDSINHGSFEKIRDRVVIKVPGNGSIKPEEFEQEWISQYVRKRDAWLESIPRLASTDYRTDFFLAQIARGNWNLNLPLNVHGYKLTEAIFAGLSENPFGDLSEDEIKIEIPQAAEPQPMPTSELPVVVPATSNNTYAAAPQAEASTSTDNFKAFIPQIDRARAWIRNAVAGTGLGGVLAVVLGAPVWVQIALFVLVLTIVIGAIVIFVKYHDKIFAYVTNMNTLRATTGVANPIVSGDTPK